MKKLQSKLTPDYDSKKFKQEIGKMLADRVIPKLTDKKRAKNPTTMETTDGTIEVSSDVAAWFLGPRGENVDLFSELVSIALNDHVFWRRNFHPTDPSPLTESMKRDEAYLDAVDLIKTEFYALLAQLKKSGPFASMRYQGHMTWDQTLPGMAGYFAAMLYNQNNVALEASPITTVLEVEACEDLCYMLGYQETSPKPWGHLTCGGSTANIEALWAARNLKFYPFSFRKGLTAANPTVAEQFTVNLPSGTSALLKDLDNWQILNLSVDEVLNLFNRAVVDYNVDQVTLNGAIEPYSLQNMGFLDFAQEFLTDSTVGDPVVLVPASKHYSLPKGAAILGLGAKNMHTVPLDIYGRMDVNELKTAIDDYLSGNTDDGKKHPIVTVVAVFGTTEEGNVDPLVEILNLQKAYRAANVDFAVHADCAWGGYFASLLRDDGTGGVPIAVSQYVIDQYQALGSTDTITIDPHKTGYLPYPAGALCYRNMAMRSLIAFEAPYINSDESDVPPEWSLGTYGIEGSKPGAAAAGVYLSHAAIPLNLQGYGKLMTLTAYNCKIFHWKLLEASRQETDFIVEPTPHWPESNQTKEESVKNFLNKLSGKTPQSILNDTTGTDLATLREAGADLNILTYAFNYKVNGTLVTDLDKVNALNERIYDRISLKADGRDIYNYKILVSTTSFYKDTYGEVFFEDYRKRLLGMTAVPASSSGAGEHIVVMRSTIMDPWITEDVDGKPFVDYIVAELFDIVREVVAEVVAEEAA
ncbi:pyridoxal-dependent decarboxylase [Okeania sp.]|uniref:pyridoxal phosphate-dependent decarboxylase family protein n=1 Tax=Okeania sp. TaxID=3100323 RepID=UPI002B4B002E|nr:pyridoxal-dependent decarboxylase [Okeania sp.]MEB3339427.1 pyridoxal-dependent decarboxylase [Okeania sp.]